MANTPGVDTTGPKAVPAKGRDVAVPSLNPPKSEERALREWLVDHGVNWLDEDTIAAWISEARDNGDGQLDFKEFGKLLDRVGFFRKVFDPYSGAYVKHITGKAGKALLPNVRTVKELIANLNRTNLIAYAQGKNVWEALEATTIIAADSRMSEGTQDYLTELVTDRINNDTEIDTSVREKNKDKGKTEDQLVALIREAKDKLIEKATRYIQNGEIGMLTGLDVGRMTEMGYVTQPNNTDHEDKPYDYMKGLDSGFTKFIKDAYMELRNYEGKDKVCLLYTTAGLNSLFNAQFSIKTVYAGQRRLLDKDLYSNVEKIFKKIKSLEKRVDELKEEGRTAPAKKKELAEAEELLAADKKFFRFACMFQHEGGKGIERAFENKGDSETKFKVMHKISKKDLGQLQLTRTYGADRIWNALVKAGYIDQDGVVQPAFDRGKKEFRASFKPELEPNIVPLNAYDTDLVYGYLMKMTEPADVRSMLWYFKHPIAIGKTYANVPVKSEQKPAENPATKPVAVPAVTAQSQPTPAPVEPSPAPEQPSTAPASLVETPAASSEGVSTDRKVTNFLQRRYMDEFNIEFSKGDSTCAAEALGNYVFSSVLQTTSKPGISENMEALANTPMIKRLNEPSVKPSDIASMVETLRYQDNRASKSTIQILLALKASNVEKYEEVMAALRNTNPTMAADLEREMGLFAAVAALAQ